MRDRWADKTNDAGCDMRSVLSVLAAVLVGLHAGGTPRGSEQSGSLSAPGPPVPFEDRGACPFEGCVYREWTAMATVEVRAERRRDAPVAYTLRAKERVRALTGVVITIKAGRVQFRESRTLRTLSGPVRIDPGETLYLLTYQGEGFTKAWLRGELYTDVDTVDFYNGVCDVQPTRCAGTIVEKSQTEWWVQVRNRLGRTGWTDQPEKFDGKDALGGQGTRPDTQMEPTRR